MVVNKKVVKPKTNGMKPKTNKKNSNKHTKGKQVAKVDSSSSEDSEKEISVDLEFFNMAEVDFHAVKQFLSVAFGTFGHSLNLSDLSSFITEELADHVGTTVKSEGEQSDPLAFCSVLPFSFHPDRSQSLREFIKTKIDGNEKMKSALEKGKCALIINERFMNLPAGVAGPMLENLANDWENGVKEDGNLMADHVFYLTPTFTLVKSQLDEELGVADREKAKEESDEMEQFYYQEAEYLEEFAESSVSFKVSTVHSTTDSRRAFTENGVDAARRLYLLTRAGLAEFVRTVNEKLIE